MEEVKRNVENFSRSSFISNDVYAGHLAFHPEK